MFEWSDYITAGSFQSSLFVTWKVRLPYSSLFCIIPYSPAVLESGNNELFQSRRKKLGCLGLDEDVICCNNQSIVFLVDEQDFFFFFFLLFIYFDQARTVKFSFSVLDSTRIKGGGQVDFLFPNAYCLNVPNYTFPYCWNVRNDINTSHDRNTE